MSKLFLAPAQRYTVDDKNRFRIPTAFVEALGQDPILLPGVGGRLNLLPYDYFVATHCDLFEADLYDSNRQDETTSLFGSTAQVSVDSLGRITLPESIVKNFGVGKELVIIGKGRYIEIWTAEKFAAREELLRADNIGKTLQNLKGIISRSKQGDDKASD